MKRLSKSDHLRSVSGMLIMTGVFIVTSANHCCTIFCVHRRMIALANTRATGPYL